MSNQLIETNKQNAEIYKGNALCKQKFTELLAEFNLPKGLVPLENTIEFGYNRSTGFVWIKQDKKAQHTSPYTGSTSSYDTEITCFIENRRLKKLHGVKTKVVLVWIALSEIFIDDPSSGQITFVTSTGLSKSNPVEHYVLKEDTNASKSDK